MTYKYATQGLEGRKYAKAVFLSQGISTKNAVEVCRFIRGLEVARAEKRLEEVIAKRTAVPFRRYLNDVGHRAGIGPGRYPVKTAECILKALRAAVSNAGDKGMLSEGLVIYSIIPQRASRPMRYGRRGRRKAKRTHIEVVLVENEPAQATRTEKGKSPETEKPSAEQKPIAAENKPEPQKAKEAVVKQAPPAAKPKKVKKQGAKQEKND